MSAIQLEPWQLISLFIAFVSGMVAAGRMLAAQIDKRLETRFVAMEVARQESTTHWDGKFAAVLADQKEGTEAWRSLERDFLKFRGDLPLEYVRREDFIRNQSLIEAKLDGIALHIQNLQLQRTKQ